VDRPNVLLMYTDQQRWDALGASGNELIQTPHLDALAQDGALFEYAYVNAPVCMPSRHSMLSGRYPETVGTTCKVPPATASRCPPMSPAFTTCSSLMAITLPTTASCTFSTTPAGITACRTPTMALTS